MNSYRKNIVIFDEKSENNFPYSSSTKKRWKSCWQQCVAVHKIIIGGALNALNTSSGMPTEKSD
jgi:hypothetical protein